MKFYQAVVAVTDTVSVYRIRKDNSQILITMVNISHINNIISVIGIRPREEDYQADNWKVF